MTFSFTKFLHHTQRRTTVGRTPLDVISSSQKPLPDITEHSQQTNIHVPGGIWTHNLSSQPAAGPRLRPRGHWDRHHLHLGPSNDLFLNSKLANSSPFATRVTYPPMYSFWVQEVAKTLHRINPLTPNDQYSGRTARLTSKRCILYIYSTNICTAYFKYGINSQFFLFKMQFVS